MSLPVATGVGFAIAGGAPADLGGLLHVQPPARRGFGRRRLFVSVEPLQPTERGREVAAAALRALREGFAGATGQPVAAAIGRAFADANAAVREENRQRPNDGPDRRVFVGATAVVLDGRDLIVAQVPPTQAAIVQDGQVYAFPSFSSWSPVYEPAYERLGPDAEPLGRSERATVDLYRTVVSGGDLVFLCASAIPIAMARTQRAAASTLASEFVPPDLQEALRPGDPARVMDHLEDVIERHDLDDAHAACVTVGRLHCLDARIARETAARIGLAWGVTRPVARPAAVGCGRAGRARRRSGRRVQASAGRRGELPDPGGERADALRPMRRLLRDGMPARLLAARARRPAPVAPLRALRRDPPVPIQFPLPVVLAPERSAAGRDGVGPGGGAAGQRAERLARVIPVALPLPVPSPPLPPVPSGEVWRHAGVAARRRAEALVGQLDHDAPSAPRLTERLRVAAMTVTERVAPPRPARPIKRPVRIGSGALTIQRHRPGLELGLSSDWRARLPRVPFGHLGRPLLIGFLAVLIVLSTAGYVREFVLPDRAAAEIARHLEAVDTHMLAAERSEDPILAARELGAASDALERAVDAGAAADVIDPARTRLGLARDRAGGIVRLVDGERLGGVPPMPAGGYRLVQSGADIYLVGEALYRYEAAQRRLIRVLAPGDRLGETIVGSLYHASLDDGGLVLTDGSTAFSRNQAGEWEVRSLGAADGQAGIWAAAPSAGYDGNLYVLDSAVGSILKFGSNDLAGAPLDWTGGAEQDALRSGRDLIVDGTIYVLRDDGSVLRFYQGVLERTYGPPADADLLDPVALSPSADGGSLFIVDAGDATSPGRVLELNLQTGQSRALVADPIDGGTPLSGISDVVVDQARGVVYLVTADALWRFSLPG